MASPRLAARHGPGARLLRRLAPAAVVGFGGYPSVPTMLAAATLGLPTLIHEQNAMLGRANRLLASRVGTDRHRLSGTAGLRPADRTRAVDTGNPVRPAIAGAGGPPLRSAGARRAGRAAGHRRQPGRAHPGRGRAGGAGDLAARMAPTAAGQPAGAAGGSRRGRRAYAGAGIAAEIASFFDDVPARLARAHLVICRAGASTVAELAAIGRPAILVPYPHATDDHQTANARAFAAAGGGWVIAQADLHPHTLAADLERLLADGAALTAMAGGAAAFGRRDAARRLAALALALEPGAGARRSARHEGAAARHRPASISSASAASA